MVFFAPEKKVLLTLTQIEKLKIRFSLFLMLQTETLLIWVALTVLFPKALQINLPAWQKTADYKKQTSENCQLTTGRGREFICRNRQIVPLGVGE